MSHPLISNAIFEPIYPTKYLHRCDYEYCKKETRNKFCRIHNVNICSYIKHDNTICGRNCRQPSERCFQHRRLFRNMEV